MTVIIRNSLFVLLALNVLTSLGQGMNNTKNKPRLVVGIIVDQMRAEYLNRFYDKFGEGGFKRLMNEGFNNKNTHYNYIPTKTAPGHASVYTGATPAIHGIIGNSWYDRSLGRQIENVEDIQLGALSPQNLLVTTISDELKLSNQMRSKVIGISIKDRGAILPVGHLANAAYWYDGDSGHFISSIYYQKTLPEWVRKFNATNIADSLLQLTWNTLLPIEQYVESGPDNTPYEEVVIGKKEPVFPYDLKKLRKENGNFDFLPETPFGNTITTRFAMEAIMKETLGKGNYTDFVAISYSSPDKIGHAFGPKSVEIQDTYLRLDKEIAALLVFLDNHVGKDNYLLFLTADHAAAEVPNYLKDNRVPAGLIDEKVLKASLNNFLSTTYGQGNWIEYLGNEQVFLNRKFIEEKNVNIEQMEEQLSRRLLLEKGVARALPSSVFIKSAFTSGLMGRLQNGYHPKRSGDVLIVYEPGWAVHGEKGTTHGSGYTYDTHVPLLWYGWNVKPGHSYKEQSITDIAPTISLMLDIQIPNGSMGQPVFDLLESKPPGNQVK